MEHNRLNAVQSHIMVAIEFYGTACALIECSTQREGIDGAQVVFSLI
jgi:hypothetical protein